MADFVSSDPLDNLTDTTQRPITIYAKRAPTTNDRQPANTCWVDRSVVPPVLYYSNGANSWAPSSSTSSVTTITGSAGGPIAPFLGNIIFAPGTNMTSIVGAGNTLTFNAAAGGGSIVFNGDTGSTVAGTTPINLLGGTGLSSVGNGTNTVTFNVDASVPLSFASDSGSAVPAANALTIIGGTNVTTSATGSTVTINASGGSSFTWQAIGASQALAASNGYFCTAGGALVLTLPAVSAVGATIEVALDGSTSWSIAQNAGNQVRIGNQQTTAGAGGSLTSTAQGNCLTLVCQTANARWVATKITGNITVV